MDGGAAGLGDGCGDGGGVRVLAFRLDEFLGGGTLLLGELLDRGVDGRVIGHIDLGEAHLDQGPLALDDEIDCVGHQPGGLSVLGGRDGGDVQGVGALGQVDGRLLAGDDVALRGGLAVDIDDLVGELAVLIVPAVSLERDGGGVGLGVLLAVDEGCDRGVVGDVHGLMVQRQADAERRHDGEGHAACDELAL